MTPAPPDLRTHLTAALAAWDNEARELDTKISTLVVLKDGVSKQMEAARLLLAGVSTDADPHIPEQRKSASAKTGRARSSTPTLVKQWQDQILAIVGRFDRGCTYAELRSELMKSALGSRLAVSDKSYQRAMSKLGNEGAIERGYGRVFTPTAFKVFDEEVKTGNASPVQSQPMARSPMGEAILSLVYESPGAKSRQIIGSLRTDPEFNAALTPHESGAYNIIARLVRRRQIVKRDDGGCFPGVAFPYDLLGLQPKGERAPNSSAVGALSAGGVTAPPIESQPALRLIG